MADVSKKLAIPEQHWPVGEHTTAKYVIPTTLQEVETALDGGRLYGCANSNRAVWWKLRRNGQTKKWKTRPDDFRIPVKMGLRTCGQVTPDTIALFRIADSPADAAGGASIGTVGAGERDNA